MAERTRTAAWKRIRRRILRRDGHTCQRCGDRGNEVNHIIPAGEGGDDSPENLETLCPSCHQPETVAQTNRGHARRAAAARHPGETHPGLV